MIPILNLTRQYDRLKDRIDAALVRVAASGYYILGPEIKAFEAEMAEWLGVKHVISCANGTDALFLALKALKISTDVLNQPTTSADKLPEVITTPFSFVATSEAIVRAGARPVFVDIEPDSMNMDVSLLEAAITPNTRAIMPVHIFGQPANMDAIKAIAKKHNLPIIEDCAQAIGALYDGQSVGGIGDIGCFSFFPSKNLGAMGDGGMCVTNSDELAERLQMLRVHGSRERYYHEEPGINSRLDEMQAAVLREKLKHLKEWNHARGGVADRYDALLKPLSAHLKIPARTPNTQHVFHQYTIQLSEAHAKEGRKALQAALLEAGVQSMIYYPVPLYSQQTHANLHVDGSRYPVCESLSDRVLSLPMFPEITLEEQTQVAEALTKCLAEIPVPA